MLNKKNIKQKIFGITMLFSFIVGTAWNSYANTNGTGTFTTTTGNAYEDAQRAGSMDSTLKAVEDSMTQSIDGLTGSGNSFYGSAASAVSGIGLGSAMANLIPKSAPSMGNVGRKTDTGSTPKDWKIPKLKPWEWILIGIFTARELREISNPGGSANEKLNNPDYVNTPLGQIGGHWDIRATVLVAGFKTLGNIADKMGKTISSVMGITAFALLLIEISLITFKGMVAAHTVNPLATVTSAIKENIVHIFFGTFIMVLLTTGMLWRFYTGALFQFSMKVGGVLTGQNFTMNSLPEYISKLLNAPISLIFAGAKMFLNPKMLINSYLPILTIVAGLMLLFMAAKASIELMQILIDYLLVGMFGMVTIVFSLFSITRSIGMGIINAIMAAMMNVIILFTSMGLLFNMIDQLGNTNMQTSAGTILGQLVLIMVVVVLIKNTKSIGQSINSGSNGFVSGGNLLSETINAFFDVLTTAAIGSGVVAAGGNAAFQALKEQGVEAVKNKVFNKGAENINRTLKENGVTFGDKLKLGLEGLKDGKGLEEAAKEIKNRQNTLNVARNTALSIAQGDVNNDPLAVRKEGVQGNNGEVQRINTSYDKQQNQRAANTNAQKTRAAQTAANRGRNTYPQNSWQNFGNQGYFENQANANWGNTGGNNMFIQNSEPTMSEIMNGSDPINTQGTQNFQNEE